MRYPDPAIDCRFQCETLSPKSARVWVGGQLDVYSSPHFKRALMAELQEGRTQLTVDLSGVTYVDCTGLGVLIGMLKRCREVDGDVTLEIPEEHPSREILRITGLEKIFTIRVPSSTPQQETCLV